jgi:acetyltransferase-like isoleucine patch superfamily enzyme
MKKIQDKNASGNSFKRLLKLPFLFPAWFAPHNNLRVFFHRMRGVKIGMNVEIGYFCIIGNVHPEMIIIEDNSIITARVTILEHDNSYYYTGRGDVKIGVVRIGKGSFVGIGSVIMPGISVGDNAIIGSLSFVNKDVPPNAIFAGNPARILR